MLQVKEELHVTHGVADDVTDDVACDVVHGVT